jgi:hypothetical protein
LSTRCGNIGKAPYSPLSIMLHKPSVGARRMSGVGIRNFEEVTTRLHCARALNGPLPEAPKKVAFMALQTIASTSSAIGAMSVLDAILGREISVARPVDEHPRPAFIAPTSLSITLS